MTLQLPQRFSFPIDFSVWSCCTRQSLTASLPPEGCTGSAFRCTALLCTSNYLNVYFRNGEFTLAYSLWQHSEWWFHIYQKMYLKIPNEQQRTCRSRLTKGGVSRATSDVTALCTSSLISGPSHLVSCGVGNQGNLSSWHFRLGCMCS